MIPKTVQAYKNWVKLHGEEEQQPGLTPQLTNDQVFFVAFGQVWVLRLFKPLNCGRQVIFSACGFFFIVEN